MFCSMLKKSIKTRDIPVIFISVLNTPQDRIRGYQAGAVDFIVKPFEEEELILRINTHLKMYKKQQELEIYNKKMNKIINDQIHKMYEAHKNILNCMSILISKRNHEVSAHLDRIGKNSRILALGLQLSPIFRDQITNSFIDGIEIAAPLHDIGKITIDEFMFQTEDTADEKLEEMKMHIRIGAEILDEINTLSNNNDLLKMALDIVKYHHEKWDGSGYPAGLSGKDIPLSARIVAIVDAYDSYADSSSTDDKIYSHENSVELFMEDAGKFFDPEIISVFLKIQNKLIR